MIEERNTVESFFIANLLATIEIPHEGTLSRVLYKDDAIRMVGFAFDTDQELTEHTSASTAIVQVVTGAIDFTVDGTTHHLGPHSWLAVPPRRPHSLRALEPAVVLLTLIKDRSETSE
jgi:quercetin dioxygenase-like cupin family protein